MDTEKMRKEVSTEECSFEVDKEEVKLKIHSSGTYTEPGLTLQKWEGDKGSEYYLVSAEKNNFSYRGILNSKFQRHNYGLNIYTNGDVYFGNYDNDFRDKHGAYLFAPVKEDGYVYSEMYFGLWKDNMKDHHGIYTWIKQKEGTSDFDNAELDAFVGDIQYENMKRGCYFSKINNNYYIYYGSFDISGYKTDNRAFIYDNQKDRVFCGKIFKDKIVNGYLMFHEADGNFLTLIYVEFDENQNLIKTVRMEDIDQADRNKKIDEMAKFRTLIFEEECFMKIHQKWKEVKNAVENDIKNENVYNDEIIFPKLMKLTASYNDITLFRNLEKLLTKKNFWGKIIEK